MKTFYALLLGIGTLFLNVSCDKFIPLIKDFLLQQEIPTKITAILCWTKDEKLRLLKTLYGDGFQVALPKFSANNLTRTFPEEHNLYLTDLNCNGVKEILQAAEELNLFSHPYRWLVLQTNSTNILDGLKITTDSQVFLAEEDLDISSIKAVYKITKSSKLLSNHVAKWTNDSGFEYFNKLIIPRNRSNLMGLRLNVSHVVTDLDTLNHLSDYVNPHVDPVTKINYIFILHLMDAMNASSNFIMQRDWGYRNSASLYYSGMIGDLQRGIAELGGSPAFFTNDRIPVIEYVASTAPTTAVFIFRAPPLSYVTNIFTLPFEHLVWISCLALIVLTSMLLYVIVIWELRKSQYLPEENEDQVTRLRPNFFDAMMVQVGGVCQQGYDDEPKSSAGRITFIFSFIALMFLYTSFSANIVALLQSTSDSIRTVEDLLNSRLQLGVDDQPYNRHYFAAETEPIRKTLYQEKIAPKGQPPNFMTVEEGISRMRNEFFAFNVERGAGYKMIRETFYEHEKCGLMEVSYLRVTHPWMPIRKNSSYQEIIKVGLKKIHESGIRNREVSYFFQKKPPCVGKGSNFMSVGLIDCYYAFQIFGMGAGLALALLILEILLKKITRGRGRYCMKLNNS